MSAVAHGRRSVPKPALCATCDPQILQLPVRPRLALPRERRVGQPHERRQLTPCGPIQPVLGAIHDVLPIPGFRTTSRPVRTPKRCLTGSQAVVEAKTRRLHAADQRPRPRAGLLRTGKPSPTQTVEHGGRAAKSSYASASTGRMGGHCKSTPGPCPIVGLPGGGRRSPRLPPRRPDRSSASARALRLRRRPLIGCPLPRPPFVWKSALPLEESTMTMSSTRVETDSMGEIRRRRRPLLGSADAALAPELPDRRRSGSRRPSSARSAW